VWFCQRLGGREIYIDDVTQLGVRGVSEIGGMNRADTAGAKKSKCEHERE
jgi:hypothetical protein